MNNGLQKINLLTLLILIFFNINYLSANEIEVAPLINLNEISPSYDDLDEDLIDLDIPVEVGDNNKFYDSNKNSAHIGVLDKVTAQVSSIKILSGEEVLIHDLKIINKSCYISLPEEKPMVAVYLVVEDTKGENNFSGWMVKGLPSVSSMEHPLYDIWVKDCA
jgi:hypothetical protein